MTMNNEDLLVERRDGILLLSFNRPVARNAQTLAGSKRMVSALKELDEDDGLRESSPARRWMRRSPWPIEFSRMARWPSPPPNAPSPNRRIGLRPRCSNDSPQWSARCSNRKTQRKAPERSRSDGRLSGLDAEAGASRSHGSGH
jgi:hypothetical protein